MEPINTKLLRQLLRTLEGIERAIREPVEQHEDATSTTNPAQNHEHLPEPQTPLHVIRERPNAEITQEEANRKGTEDFQRKSLRVQWSLFAATLLAFGAAGYYACVAKNTLDEIKRQTDAAVQGANAATSAAASASRQAKTAEDANALTARISVENSRQTREALFVDERPWVAVKTIGASDFVPDALIYLRANLTNPGKTMATNVSVKATVSIHDHQLKGNGLKEYVDSKERKHALAIEDPQRFTMFPNLLYPYDTHSASSISAADIRAIESADHPSRFVYFIGEIQYSTTLDKIRHETDFCAFYSRQTKSFNMCLEHNGAN